MKILRFLGFFMVLVLPSVVVAVPQVCQIGEYGNGSCTQCPTGYTSYDYQGRNAYRGQCYKECSESCVEYDWSGYIPSNVSGFSITPFFNKPQEHQILFYGLATQGIPTNQTCDTLNSKYCNYNAECEPTATSACKPGHRPVEFHEADGTLIDTYYVVNTTAWSTQNTTPDATLYSATIYPVFTAPVPKDLSNKRFIGYYDAQIGGDKVIDNDLTLTFEQANGISGSTPKVLYAQYEDICNTEFYLDAGENGTLPDGCAGTAFYAAQGANGFTPPTQIGKCMPSNSNANCEFTGFYYNGVQYYDANLTLLVSEWTDCDTSTVTLTAGWNCPEPVTCPCGEYLPAGAKTAEECETCPAGSYCPGDTWTGAPYDADQGKLDCADDTACATATSEAGACTINECFTTCTVGCTQPNNNCPTFPVTPAQCDYQTGTVSGIAYLSGKSGCNTTCEVEDPYCKVTSCPAGYWYTGNNSCMQCNSGYNQPSNNHSGGEATCIKSCTVMCDLSLPLDGCPEHATCVADPDSNQQYGTTNQTEPNNCYNSETPPTQIQPRACRVKSFECDQGYTFNEQTKQCEENVTCSRITFADNNGSTPSINASLSLYRKKGDTTHWYTDDKCLNTVANPPVQVNPPTRAGHAFSGYYTAASAGVQIFETTGNENTTNTQNWDVPESIELQAQWEQLYIVQCPLFNNPNAMFTLGNLVYGQPGVFDDAGMAKGCYQDCPTGQEPDGWDVYLNGQGTPTNPLPLNTPIQIIGGVTYGNATPITLRVHCVNTCYRVDFDDTTNGGTGVNNPPFYKIAGQTSWYSDDKCSTLVNDPMVSTPTKANAEFVGYDYTTPSPNQRIFDYNGDLTNNGASLTISAPTTLYAQYECYEGYHLNNNNACEPCPDDQYWNGSSCVACSAGAAPGFEHSISPYNWSVYQCYRECDTTCEDFNVTQPTGYTNTYSIGKFATGNNHQIEFYGNASANDNLNTCGTVTYCPYVVSENSHLPYKAPSVPVSFYASNDYNNAFDVYHIVGVVGSGTNTALDVESAFEWSQIVGLGQKLYQNNDINGRYISTPIFYPVSLAPTNEPAGMAFNGYYNPRPASGVDPTQYINSTRALGIQTGQSIINSITGDIQTPRQLYAQSGHAEYQIIYEMNGGTNYNGHPTSYVHGTTTHINGVPTRNLSEFLGWCTDSALTDCYDDFIIGPDSTGDVTVYASWDCVSPYHSNPAGTACEACDDNQYWNGQTCEQCGEGATSGFPHSKQPFNWSINTCYRECPSGTTLGATGQTCDANSNLYGLTCSIDVDFTDFTGSTGKQVEFYGNHTDGINTCNNVDNTYCARGLFGCGGSVGAVKSMTAPVDFRDPNDTQTFGTRYIFGSRGGANTIDLGVGKLWSLLAGSGQKTDVLHNNIGGVAVDYQYTHIIYPTYLAPTQADIPGMAFDGYYSARTGGTQEVSNTLGLDNANAMSIITDTTGNSNTARKVYARYSNVDYTLTYSCGTGGTGNPTPTQVTGIHYGDPIVTAANTCQNPGHDFGGWVVSPAGEIKQPGDSFTWQYTENQVFTADWSGSIIYNIDYELYGGTASSTGMPRTYTYESGAVINGVPTRDFSIFDGWCTDATLTNCAMTQTIAPNTETGDKTFYAKWKCDEGYTLNNNLCDANTINLTYNANGHGTAPTQPDSCTYGTIFTLPAAIVPTPADGYVFNQWKAENDHTFNADTRIACDYANLGVYQGSTTITATWNADTIIIDWNENGGTAISNGNCTYNGDLTLANAPLYEGHTFNGWLLANGTYANAGNTMTGGCTSTYIGVTSGTSTAITAQWCDNCVQPEHGSCTLTPQMNGQCKYTTSCDAGYDIVGDGTATPNCTTLHEYTITYQPNGGTPNENKTQSVDYLAEFNTLGATNSFTKDNNLLTGWHSVSGGSFTALSTSYTYNVTTDTVLEAVWDECTCDKGTGVATCNTSVSNNECQGVATCQSGFISPNVVCQGTTCTAACSHCPAGHIPDGDNGCQPCSAGTYQIGDICEPCHDGSISVAGSTTCEPCAEGTHSNANHTACDPNTITIVYANGGHGTAPANASCEYGNPFTLAGAIIAEGYTFNKWSVHNNTFDANESITCNYGNLGVYGGNVTITATWNSALYPVTFDANGGTGGQSAAVQAAYNQPMPAISSVAPVNTGYTFIGWYDNEDYLHGTQYYNANGVGTRQYDKTTGTTLYAGWTPNIITLVYNANGHGAAPSSRTCTYGNDVILASEIFAEGFLFKNWKVGNRTFNASATIPCNMANLGVSSGSVTLVAQWEPRTYIVDYNCAVPGGNAPDSTVATYNEDFTPALHNSCQYNGHTFAGWKVSDTNDIRAEAVAFKWLYLENKTLTAQWNAQVYNISYELNGGTNYANTPLSYVFGIGATINGTPTRNNSVFKGWCTDSELQNCAMSQTIGRTDMGDKTFYAKWACANGYVPNATNTACDACETGQHAENGQCVDDVIECTLPDAAYATRTWNQSNGAYGQCIVETCEFDYHLVSNTCVKDTRTCTLEHGYGTQDWNGTDWGKCVAETCESGFEIVGDHCEECSNRRLDGTVVVSSYANGCEIASCMYHGQKYILENNECVPICETKSDETGSMAWNDSRKKCVRTCNPGYKMW